MYQQSANLIMILLLNFFANLFYQFYASKLILSVEYIYIHFLANFIRLLVNYSQ